MKIKTLRTPLFFFVLCSCLLSSCAEGTKIVGTGLNNANSVVRTGAPKVWGPGTSAEEQTEAKDKTADEEKSRARQK